MHLPNNARKAIHPRDGICYPSICRGSPYIATAHTTHIMVFEISRRRSLRTRIARAFGSSPVSTKLVRKAFDGVGHLIVRMIRSYLIVYLFDISGKAEGGRTPRVITHSPDSRVLRTTFPMAMDQCSQSRSSPGHRTSCPRRS